MAASANTETTNPSVSGQSERQDDRLQAKDFRLADRCVSVRDNQFVFSPSNDIPLSSVHVQDLQRIIDKENKFILAHHGTINPDTKEITFRGELGKKRKSHEIRTYFWGVRHIFRSNAAVRNFVDEINDSATVFDYGQVIGYLGFKPAGILSTVGMAYFHGMAYQLKSFNNHHKNSKINLDIYASVAYHLDVWHD